MPIDSITVAQYSGYFHKPIMDSLNAGKVNEVTEEIRIQRILEEERKRVQEVVNVRKQSVEKYIIEKDVKRKRAEYDELVHVDTFA